MDFFAKDVMNALRYFIVHGSVGLILEIIKYVYIVCLKQDQANIIKSWIYLEVVSCHHTLM